MDKAKMKFYELRVNQRLDVYTKKIALAAASSVVSVKVYLGGDEIHRGSGFIIQCDTTADNQFQSIIITSASLLRTGATGNTILNDVKAVVVLPDGELCDGQIEAHDIHYNLAAIMIQLDHPLKTAKLRHVDDLMIVDPSKSPTYEATLHPSSNLFRLEPGSVVIALGRYFDDKTDIMVAPGAFSIEQCRFDCKELLRSTCRITKCGTGGPLVNRNAEVIGVNFFASYFTPFLPINIVQKWWNHLKKFRNYCRPWLGMELSNIFTIEACILEKILQKFPDIKKGILVDEVTPDSPVGYAGVHRDDIIVACDGKSVDSFLQFFDMIWDKVGKPVELAVVRRADNSRLVLSVMVENVGPNHFNRWPLE